MARSELSYWWLTLVAVYRMEWGQIADRKTSEAALAVIWMRDYGDPNQNKWQGWDEGVGEK